MVKVTGSSNRRVSLAALIAIKPGQAPRLIYRVHKNRRRAGKQRKGFTEADYARFFDAAHQQLTGPLVVVWDNSNTHLSVAMARLAGARDWLTIYQLPPYAHELNPVELVWSHLKRSLANLAKRNIAQLTVLVKTRLKRMQCRLALPRRIPSQHPPEPDALLYPHGSLGPARLAGLDGGGDARRGRFSAESPGHGREVA